MLNRKRSKFVKLNLSDISALSILLPTFLVFITFSKQNKTLKKLSVFILLTAVFEAYAKYWIISGWNNNMFMFHYYSYFEVFSFAIIFYGIVNNWMKKVILILATIYLTFSLVNISLWESLIEFNANQRYVGGIVIISMTLLYFIKLFIDAKIQRIEGDHYFWFSSTLLIYTAGTLFLFILGNEVQTDDNYVYWDLHSVHNILLNIGFTITLWMGTRISR